LINYSALNTDYPGLLNYGGGAIFNRAGWVNVVNSTIASSHSRYGGGVFNDTGLVTISGSVFSLNGALGGGGVFNSRGIVWITNSTLHGNIAYGIVADERPTGFGGALFNNGPNGSLTLTNSTVTANYALIGGGVYSGGTATVKSSIIAQNLASSRAADVEGTFVSQGFNLIGKDESGTFTAATDRTGTAASPLNPKFDTRGLRNNGGPTQTIALLSGSPAVDRGTSIGLTGALTTDQRGPGFLRTIDKAPANAIGGDGTDIGAYEVR
jgi:hypothetical protein